MSKNQFLLTRRRTLLLGLGTFLATIACSDQNRQTLADNDLTVSQDDLLKRSFSVNGRGSLKKRAAAKGLIYGGESAYEGVSADEDFANAIRRECNMLMNAGLKWHYGSKPLRPTPDTFDFTAGDWTADFAQKHNLLFRGHTLVWHQGLPPWFEETVKQENAREILVNHVQTVAKHFAGRIHSWDLLNEAIELGDGRADNLRKTPWLEFIGPEYVEIAFRTAAEADPKAMLVYNDYGLEYDTPDQEQKRTAVLKFLEDQKSKGTPIHALGIQSHLDHLEKTEKKFSAKKFREFLKNVADLGLKIMLTELDVNDTKLAGDINLRDRYVAAAYEDYLSVVLDEPAVIAVITFGLSDRYTWLTEFPREDGQPVRPLPLDAQMKRKLAWQAMARAIDAAPQRG